MRDWMIESGIASESQIEGWEAADKEAVEAARDLAWEAFQSPIRDERDRLVAILKRSDSSEVAELTDTLSPRRRKLTRSHVHLERVASSQRAARHRLAAAIGAGPFLEELPEGEPGALQLAPLQPVRAVAAEGAGGARRVLGRIADGRRRQVLLRNFDANFARDPRLFVIGEDVGRLGDVNLVFEGLQAKYGDLRVTDTGIREATILGQSIGAAMRGLRPICDIQYLDYFLYALQTASDDLASLHWRTVGGQKAPARPRRPPRPGPRPSDRA